MTMFGDRASSGIPASRHRPRSVGGTGDLQAEILCWLVIVCSVLLPSSFLRLFLFVVSVSVSSLRCLRLIRERRRHEHATGNDIAPSTEHRARPRHPRRSRRARAGLWTLPVLWKTRAIPSASTDAVQKARFPQHLGRRRRRPQAPQATLSLLSTTTSRVGSRRSVATTIGGN